MNLQLLEDPTRQERQELSSQNYHNKKERENYPRKGGFPALREECMKMI
jgi:hypothetical protein